MATPVGAALDASTAGLWRFDEASGATTIADASGNGRTLTVGGSPVPTASAGVINNAWTMVGTNAALQYFYLAGDAAIDALFRAEWTMEGWVYLAANWATATADAFSDIWKYGNTNVVLAAAAIDRNPRALSYAGSSYVPPLSTWLHVAHVRRWDAANSRYEMRCYVNGALMGTAFPHTVPANNGANTLTFGRDSPPWGNPFPGAIDDFRFSSVARTDSELLATYKAGRGITARSAAVLDVSTLALWRLDDLTQRNILLQSENLAASPWTPGGSNGPAAPTVTANSTDVTDPNGGNTATKLVIPAVSGANALSEVSQSFTAGTGQYVYSAWLRTASGTASVYLFSYRGAAVMGNVLCNVTTTWQRFSYTMAAGAAGLTYFIIGTDLRDATQSAKPTATVYVWGAEVSPGATLLPYQRTVSELVNANDDANHYGLVAYSSPALAMDGQLLQALSLNGSNGLQGKGDAAAGTALQGEWSAELWVRPRTGFTAASVLLAYHGLNFTTSNTDLKLLDLELGTDRRLLWQQYQTTGSVTTRAVGTALPLDTWTHVAVTRQSQGGNLWTFRTYVNGALVDTLASVAGITTGITGAAHYWTTGCYRTTGGGVAGGLLGDLDDIRVSSVRRSDADILATYNAGAGIVVVPSAPAPVAAAVDAGTGVARDLLLDPLTGDLAQANGDLVLARGRVAIRQAVRQAIQFFRGEWFLDLDAGMPLFEEILVKNPNLNAIRAALVARITAVPGIVSLDSLALAYDAGARSLTVTWAATGDAGALSGTAVLGAA